MSINFTGVCTPGHMDYVSSQLMDAVTSSLVRHGTSCVVVDTHGSIKLVEADKMYVIKALDCEIPDVVVEPPKTYGPTQSRGKGKSNRQWER